MTTTRPRHVPQTASRSILQRLATALAGAIALLYGLLYAGVIVRLLLLARRNGAHGPSEKRGPRPTDRPASSDRKEAP